MSVFYASLLFSFLIHLHLVQNDNYFIHKNVKKYFLQKTLITFVLAQKHTYEAFCTRFG